MVILVIRRLVWGITNRGSTVNKYILYIYYIIIYIFVNKYILYIYYIIIPVGGIKSTHA